MSIDTHHFLDKDSDAHGRTQARHAGAFLDGLVQLVRLLKPRDRERLYYFLTHPEAMSADVVGEVLRLLESKSNQI